MTTRHVVAIGGSDAGISAALRARELDPGTKFTVVVATALFHSMSIEAVSELDLSYTPPLGSPWDAVQVATQAWVREHPLVQPVAVTV